MLNLEQKKVYVSATLNQIVDNLLDARAFVADISEAEPDADFNFDEFRRTLNQYIDDIDELRELFVEYLEYRGGNYA